jgi:hypothetical protein
MLIKKLRPANSGLISSFYRIACLGALVKYPHNRRILEPIGNIPPAEYELMYYQQLEGSSAAA